MGIENFEEHFLRNTPLVRLRWENNIKDDVKKTVFASV
jgi:hypothetical protein